MKALFVVLVIMFESVVFNTSAQDNKCEVAEKNKKTVLDFYQKLFGDKDVAVIDQYLAVDYIQHNPGVVDGRQALKDLVTKINGRFSASSCRW